MGTGDKKKKGKENKSGSTNGTCSGSGTSGEIPFKVLINATLPNYFETKKGN
jgi:hypothetical protein